MAGAATGDHGASQLLQDLNKRERKRQQNRTAQRTYRRNQKHRIQALEAAVAQSVEGLTPPREAMLLDDILHEQEPTAAPGDNQIWAIDPVLTDSSPPLLADMARTALHRAVCSGNESMVRLLLERGADVAKQDGNGSTALHLAAESGSGELLQLLLEKSADPNATDYLGRTALFAAVLGENETTTELLLKSLTIDVNAKDSMGNVALHMAVECGSEPLALLLLAHGADINA
ncbi:hypothetical protein CORC01_02615 [Colletotrichum orchidophilum]|uniref:Uncharacterized protein n=1 Tax=Colletotrichum orchidophilum TaxID=1209926 RepID=A0A1G4BL58_9PEZI|nr:uncharacterized protein CORC01_02615 [Colletotrichum orchidophilum]OHF02036.1 hypothetical protein CORC01_02615 [Colletotrichum orchidophilum]